MKSILTSALICLVFTNVASAESYTEYLLKDIQQTRAELSIQEEKWCADVKVIGAARNVLGNLEGIVSNPKVNLTQTRMFSTECVLLTSYALTGVVAKVNQPIVKKIVEKYCATAYNLEFPATGNQCDESKYP